MPHLLLIDGNLCDIDHTLALRWHEDKDGKAVPALYRNGKRVTKAWSIVLSYDVKADVEGSNANTE